MTQAQQRTYMCNYIKNMGSHTLQQLKKLSFDEIKELFEITMTRVKDFVPMDSDRLVPKISIGSSKVGNHTEAYQTFDDMLKKFDRDDLDKLCSLVKERFSSTDPTDDKEKALWVELKRLFEPDTDDILWKLQRYMHDPLTWRLYDICGVHHVSIDRGHDIFMLVEKDYPLSKGVLMLMLVNKLLVEQSSEMENELSKKIFILANKPRHQNQRDLPRDIPLDRIEALRHDTKGVKVRMGIMQTKIELTLEQTQKGVSDEVLSLVQKHVQHHPTSSMKEEECFRLKIHQLNHNQLLKSQRQQLKDQLCFFWDYFEGTTAILIRYSRVFSFRELDRLLALYGSSLPF
ncbi:hypothetical protein Tco_1343144 [Tanacetum coccineum]